MCELYLDSDLKVLKKKTTTIKTIKGPNTNYVPDSKKLLIFLIYHPQPLEKKDKFTMRF